ncbi:MAG: ribosomal protein S18-alanine N-acetyltransferase [Bacteroidales bacterium]|jgi:ribosomal-protein-alanine acetyltransferase|nr:ribosomal protein S18-alanine N-acetyltransferase [Bacteroidales bacterium]
MEPKVNFKIRLASPTDLKAIMEIESESFGSDAFGERQMKYLMKSATSLFYVVETKHTLAGYIILLTRKNSYQMRIYSIAVLSLLRGKGVGQHLIDFALKTAEKKSKSSLKLEVRTTNSGAIQLYERNKFKPVNIIPDYYHDGCDALVMKRKI